MRKAFIENWFPTAVIAVGVIVIIGLFNGCSNPAPVPETTPPTEVVPAPNPPPSSCSVYYTQSKLSTIFTSSSATNIEKFSKGFAYACKFGIKDKSHEAMYLATVLTEVGTDLVGVRENLNYSCDALPSIFSYYKDHGGYNDDGRCNGHDANQPTIGAKIYANRLGNGDVGSGDGYTYRGGGYAQTTGYYNYNVIVVGVNNRVGTSYTTHNFADNITNTYVANLGGMGYWLQVGAENCGTMSCVTDKWNMYTESRQERENNYNRIMSY